MCKKGRDGPVQPRLRRPEEEVRLLLSTLSARRAKEECRETSTVVVLPTGGRLGRFEDE